MTGSNRFKARILVIIFPKVGNCQSDFDASTMLSWRQEKWHLMIGPILLFIGVMVILQLTNAWISNRLLAVNYMLWSNDQLTHIR